MSVANIQAAFLLFGKKLQKEIEQEDEEGEKDKGEEDEGEEDEKEIEGGDGGDERWNYCQSNNFKVERNAAKK